MAKRPHKPTIAEKRAAFEERLRAARDAHATAAAANDFRAAGQAHGEVLYWKSKVDAIDAQITAQAAATERSPVKKTPAKTDLLEQAIMHKEALGAIGVQAARMGVAFDANAAFAGGMTIKQARAKVMEDAAARDEASEIMPYARFGSVAGNQTKTSKDMWRAALKRE